MIKVEQIIIYQEIEKTIENIRLNKANTEIALTLINNLFDSIFNLCNSIIITGQYIDKKDNKFIEPVNKLVIDLCAFMFGANETVEHQINQLSDVVAEISSFISVLHRRTCLEERGRMYFSDSSYLSQFDNKIKESNNIGYNVFIQNIKLAFLDHFLAIKRGHLDALIEISESLSSLDYRNNKCTSILLDKCHFLMYKVLFRMSKDEKKYVYLYNSKDTEIDIHNTRKKIKYFKPFLDIVDSHYSDQNTLSIGLIDKRIRAKGDEINTKWKSNQDLKIEEYHTLIKFSKDINHSKKDLEDIKNDIFSISSSPDSSTHEFDTKAYDIDKMYVYNNLISSAIESNEAIDEVRKFLEDIYILQKETGIQNYFPFFKISKYTAKVIEEKLDKLASSTYSELDNIDSYMRGYRDTVNECYKTLKWCRSRNYTAFQLPYNECLKSVQEGGAFTEVFLASSFVLPLNYVEIETQLSKIDREYNRIKTQIAFYKTIKQERQGIEKIRAQISEQGTSLKNEVLEKDRKQIEILSIFSAIVLFSLSSVKLYEGIKFFSQALIFMLAFGYSLGVFVILIWLITRNYDIKTTIYHKLIIGSFMLITAVLYFTIIFWHKIVPHNEFHQLAPPATEEPKRYNN